MFSSVLITPPELLSDVFDEETIEQFRTQSRMADLILNPAALSEHRATLAETEVIFSTWGMPTMDAAFLEMMPKLRAVFYAAGTVKAFVTEAVWEREITICSGWRSNAVPVAEFSLATILLSLKQTWAYHRRLKADPSAWTRLETKGAYHSTVGLVSLGAIGRRVAQLLKPFDVNIIAYDPLANHEAAAELGIELVSLAEVFEKSDVVSLHTPWLKETENLISGDLLSRMKPFTTFINTARGAVVNEPELIEVLRERPDLTAVLDVTHPEPPLPGSPIYELPNVLLTPHIAGSIGKECRRMGRSMLEEYQRYVRGEALQQQVTRDMIDQMA